LSFGPFIYGFIGDPRPLFIVSRRGYNSLSLAPTIPFGAVRPISGKICHNYAGIDYGCLAERIRFFGLTYYLWSYSFVYAPSCHDLAS
jgi:hypothetical protein